MKQEEKIAFSYPYSRRRFMKGVASAGILAVIPWQTACRSDSVPSGILAKHSQMAADILEILFPNDGNGPDANQLHTYQYLNWILADKNYDSDIQQSIVNGFQHFANFSKEQFGKPFSKLSKKARNQLVAKANEFSWGENFLARLISIILDSLVIDPIYGTNTDEAGWKWLEHIPGSPRATQKNKYPAILERKKEMMVISGLGDLEI